MKKYVYLFNEGNKDMKNLLGGKGANLAEMTNLGLPVPSGFTITTEACNEYYQNNASLDKSIIDEILSSVESLEKITNKKFGSKDNPLLLSVRSGSRVSMPGMMDTILNLGLNDESVKGFASVSNERLAYDSYRRFIQMYSDVVMNVSKSFFEKIIDELKQELGIKLDSEFKVDDLKELIKRFKKVYYEYKHEEFPQDAKVQLIGAVEAVFKSWENDRAKVYRRLNNIPSDYGTAVNVQVMVFGNMNDLSGTGVAFTRNPSTGEKGIYGEYLINAQGEDVVAGVRTPESIDKLKEDLPDCYYEFVRLATLLEEHYKDMQDMEFTIENGKLYILQTRNGKRTAHSALKIACDLVDEGMISKEEALMRIDAKNLDQLLHPVFDSESLKKAEVITSGLAASPGCCSGKIVFNSKDAKKYGMGGLNEKVILVRLETTPEDIEGMIASQGVLTIRGGRTSHAAVVARGMGVCCVSGCGDILLDEENKKFTVGNTEYFEGDYISIDGNTGYVYKGEIAVKDATIEGDFNRIMNWADGIRKLKVRANADTVKDVLKAIELGAEGIGLCRTEHMFFESTRIVKMRKMILADNIDDRIKALDELMIYQKEDFKGIFKALKGLPVTIRYIDPPLHEFLPKKESEFIDLSKEMNLSVEEIKNKCDALKEVNPMMGHRGSRLAVTYPEIAKMQTRAIIESAIEASLEDNIVIEPELMIPLIGDELELKYIKNIVNETAKLVMSEKNHIVNYTVGTMIEVPRACVLAQSIAKEAEFFSFGTNDLTQMTFGFSRDDAAKFLDSYYEVGIYEFDPFASIDKVGVGSLVKLAIDLAKLSREDIKLGVCGEHGGDPLSIELFHKLGLDYVSCSPFRIPIARLAAAKAVLSGE